MSNHYEVPSWAGKPPVGLHLDVLKGEKLIQKLMIDEKKCYLFGRNPQINDFCIDHASCSRVHSALVYHKHLNRAFLVDLGSTHGTYIGRVQLESRKPTQLPVDSIFHFGASTRNYILRERPQKGGGGRGVEDGSKGEEVEGGLLGLPEAENDLDNLTEFNTAQNRRISMLTIPEEEIKVPSQRRRSRGGVSVRFNEEEEIINPEDIDPSIGKFRNLVQTAIIPNKKQKLDTNNPFGSGLSEPSASAANHASAAAVAAQKHQNMAAGGAHHHMTSLFSPSLSTKLGLHLPNPAPDIDLAPPAATIQTTLTLANRSAANAQPDMEPEPRKKKYAKEAWPGKKAIPSFLV